MSKDRKKLLHIHSSVNDKQPTPATLELGELGVNNAKGNAFISTKNSDGEVVRFSEDETIIGWMEQKEVFPYEGYVRGSDGNKGVTEQDLLNNKSNIIIKLNQVVPEGTDYSPYDEKVNGAKDIYGRLINPISDGGYKDGAGLAIDMSKYAMQGANPSFSSVTTTCGASLNGKTTVSGSSCGSEFNVNINEIDLTAKQDVIITADNNICEGANNNAFFYGKKITHIGQGCDGNKSTDAIIYERIPKNGVCDIKSTTVDDALEEVLERSKMHYSAQTGENSIKYCIWQDSGDCENKIEIEMGTSPSSSSDVFYLNRNKLTIKYGDVCDKNDGDESYDPGSGTPNTERSSEITIPKNVSNLGYTKLNINYGPTSGETAQGFDPGSTTNTCTVGTETITIPSCVNHLNRHYITFQSGSTSSFSSQTYDPGSDCTNSSETINIPTSITHLKEWDGSCLSIPGCAKATNFYQTSDRNMKENIRIVNPNQLSAARRIPILRFNFIDDPGKNEIFGIIAQDAEDVGLQNIVMVDKDGRKSVDYTSISMLKIAYLERENSELKLYLNDIEKRLKKLENKD